MRYEKVKMEKSEKRDLGEGKILQYTHWQTLGKGVQKGYEKDGRAYELYVATLGRIEGTITRKAIDEKEQPEITTPTSKLVLKLNKYSYGTKETISSTTDRDIINKLSAEAKEYIKNTKTITRFIKGEIDMKEPKVTIEKAREIAIFRAFEEWEQEEREREEEKVTINQ